MTAPAKSEPVQCTCAAHDDTGSDLDPHADDCARRIAFRHMIATTIILTNERATCGVHRLPFREQWPAGLAVFCVEAFRAVTAVPGIWEEARELAQLPADATLGPKLLEAVLDKRPVCCRVSPQALVDLYVATKIGQVKICTYCGRFAKGTPIETVQQGRLDHVCFVCMSTASASSQEVQ